MQTNDSESIYLKLSVTDGYIYSRHRNRSTFLQNKNKYKKNPLSAIFFKISRFDFARLEAKLKLTSHIKTLTVETFKLYL